MSLLPTTIQPPSDPIGRVDANGNVIPEKNFWLLLYNLCKQVLGTEGGLPSDALLDIESADVDAADTDAIVLRTQISNALLYAQDNLLPDIGIGANPAAKVGPTVVNGSAPTFMRSDAAPPIDLTLNYSWTGKVGWFGTAAISQLTTSVGSAAFVSGSGTGLTTGATFDGYTLQQIVRAIRLYGLLA